jgi:hypothetical protein
MSLDFRGSYRAHLQHHKVVVKVCLEYRDTSNSKWLKLESTCKKKSKRSARRVWAHATGPCFLGQDQYRTYAKGWSVNSKGERILRRRDWSSAVGYVCIP